MSFGGQKQGQASIPVPGVVSPGRCSMAPHSQAVWPGARLRNEAPSPCPGRGRARACGLSARTGCVVVSAASSTVSLHDGSPRGGRESRANPVVLVVRCDCGSSGVCCHLCLQPFLGAPWGGRVAPTPGSVFSGLKEKRVVWTEGLGLGSDMVTCSAPVMERGQLQTESGALPIWRRFRSHGKCVGPQLNPGVTEGKESPQQFEISGCALRT